MYCNDNEQQSLHIIILSWPYYLACTVDIYTTIQLTTKSTHEWKLVLRVKQMTQTLHFVPGCPVMKPTQEVEACASEEQLN